MARFGVITDTHGLEHIDVIAQALAQKGVKNAFHLGDIVYETMSPQTVRQANLAQAMLGRLAQKGGLQTDALKGNFTKAQLNLLSTYIKEAQKTTQKITTAQCRYLENAFKKRGITLDAVLGGNWDQEKPLKDVFGSRFMNGTKQKIQGLDVVGLSGGGSQPTKAIGTGLLADDVGSDRFSHRKWGRVLQQEDSIDVLLSHLPPTDGVGVRMENAVEHLKEFLLMRAKTGREMPKAILSGHRHGATRVEFNEELGTLWIQPGVGALNHNDGQHGSYVIVDVDDETKEVRSVEEYRVHTSARGKQDVELYARYLVNYRTKKIEREVVGQAVVTGFSLTQHSHFLEQDPHFRQKFDVQYTNLSAAQKDARVRANLELGREQAGAIQNYVKRVVDQVRREILVDGRSEDFKLGQVQFHDAAQAVFTTLFEEAQRRSGITLEKLDVRRDDLKDYARDLILFGELGVTLQDIFTDLRIEDTSVKKLAYNYGQGLAKKAHDTVYQRKQAATVRDLSASDFQEMAELYIPANVERRYNMLTQEALSFYSKTLEKGLYANDDLAEFSTYARNEAFKGEKLTKEELGLLGVTMPDEITASKLISEQRETLAQAVSGGHPVYSDDSGREYVSSGNDYSLISPHLKQELGLNYTPINIDELGREERIRQDNQGNMMIETADGQRLRSHLLAHPKYREMLLERQRRLEHNNELDRNQGEDYERANPLTG